MDADRRHNSIRRFLIRNAKSCFVWGAGAGIFKTMGGVRFNRPAQKRLPVWCMFLPKKMIRCCCCLATARSRHCLRELRDLPYSRRIQGRFQLSLENRRALSVVVDKGVMIHESERKDKLVFFKGSIDLVRVAAVEPGNDQNLFIALYRWSHFRIQNEKLETDFKLFLIKLFP